MFKSIELLSPAGDFDCLKSAILYGADAVYLGSTMFGMRAVAANFNFDLLNQAVKYAHERNVQVYLTCNTIPTNDDLLNLSEFLFNVKNIGVDALIVADLGVMMEAKKIAPKIPIHISTQFGVVNFKTATALYELGAKRIILARELCLNDIKFIRKKTPPELEIECFVHGAMCVSFSGRCLISQYLLNRNANRGCCAQPCRWNYFLIEKTRPNQTFPIIETNDGSYILNSKDLCLINYLQQLKESGVFSFKIEGRAKSAYYVGVVTNAYKLAIEAILKKTPVEQWILDEVETVSHRPYFEGFLFNKPNKIDLNSQHYNFSSYIRTCEVVAVVKKYDKGFFYCIQKNKFNVYDELELIVPQKKPINFKIKNLLNAKGDKIKNAPHAQMEVVIEVNNDLIFNSLDINFSGCFLRKRLKC